MSNPYGTDKALLVGTTPYFNARAVTLVACIFNIAVKPVKYNKKNKYIIPSALFILNVRLFSTDFTDDTDNNFFILQS